MVNYCCVYGCGRNSRTHKHLNYYSLPKERDRQIQWLKTAGRNDLLDKDQKRVTVSYRFCSRHFTASSIKNRHLCPDACPTRCLPGTNWSDDDTEEEVQSHNDIVCNNCSDPIVGFRYKCVTCPDYDLCQKCEMLESHPNHYMLRIPKPMKFKLADDLLKKWKKLFKAEHITPDCNDNDRNTDDSDTQVLSSDDDEPITKYAKNYDSGIDLSEDVKNKIRKEVTRVLKVCRGKAKEKALKSKAGKKDEKLSDVPSKKMKFDKDDTDGNQLNTAPELVFADVNEIKDNEGDLKAEFPTLNDPGPTVTAPMEIIPVNNRMNESMEMSSNSILGSYIETNANCEASEGQQPVMHVKLSDDLSELMIEVTSSNNQKTIYKYS